MLSSSRPLIDRQRTSSRDRSSSRNRSCGPGAVASGRNSTSPYGSPNPSSSLTTGSCLGRNPNASGFPLKSAMKHNHVHVDPHPEMPFGMDENLGRSFPDNSSSSAQLGSATGTDTKTSEEAAAAAAADEEGDRGRLGFTGVSKEKGLASTSATSLANAVGSSQTAATSSSSLSATYSRRVGFDTFGSGKDLEQTGSNTGGGTGVNYSFTLSAKSAGYERSRWSRTFLVGTDLNEYSVHALNWLLSSLVEDTDEVIILRVIQPGSTIHSQWKNSNLGMEEQREEAERVLEETMQTNGEERQISIIVEFAIGPIEETIHRMIEIYRPDSLIVGTRGVADSVWKSAFMDSISRYCVAKSPVPVVVVRPENKVKESLDKRLGDGKKRTYVNLLGLGSQSDVAVAGESNAGCKSVGNLGLERTTTIPSASTATNPIPKFLESSNRKKSENNASSSTSSSVGTFLGLKKKNDKSMRKYSTFS